MDERKQLYTFNGAVFVYDRVVASNYKGQTRAVSEKKAKANLAYQYKKANNLADFVRVQLKGELVAQ